MRVSASILISLTLIVAGIAVRIADPAALQTLRGSTFDLYQQLQPRTYHRNPVRVVDIDDQSLQRLGQWPWPRTKIADLIKRLRHAGAAAIALDIVFAEPDRTSPGQVLPLWPQSRKILALREAMVAGKLPDHDRLLAETIKHGGVITGFAVMADHKNQPVVKAGIATNGPNPLGSVPRFEGALTSLDMFQNASDGNGALTMIPDADGVLRRLQLLLRQGDTVYPTLAAEALRVAQGSKTFVARASTSNRLANLVIGRYSIPTDGAGQLYLYDTGPVAQRIVPAWQLMKDGSDPGTAELSNKFKDAIVFIGSSALGIEDVQHSPLSTVTLGVSIHAQIAEQILSGDFLIRPEWTGGLEIMATLLFCVLLVLVLRRVSALIGFTLAVISVSVTLAYSWLAFSKLGILLAPGFTVSMIVAVYLVCTISAYLVSEQQRRQVRTAFGQYLSPTMVQQLAANPELLSLGGDMRDLTIMFCDIRGFTSLSERLGAKDLSQLVNRFLTAMTGAILENGGTIDKYIGDCVMAFWNAPLDDPAHAQHACEAALAMRQRLADLNEELSAEAVEGASAYGLIEMGIGINTGQCCVGNMGSVQRFNYSVLGDNVNLAARFEEETKKFGVDMVIGKSTQQQAMGLEFQELGQITVRGRSQKVSVFTLPDADSRN